MRHPFVLASEQDHRHVGRLLVVEAFGPEAVVAEHIAVVRREANNGIVEQPLLAQGADDHAKLMVDLGAERVEGAANAQNLWPLEVDFGTLIDFERIRQIVKVACPSAVVRRVDLNIAVEVEIALQGHQRRMRVAEGQVPEAGLGRVAPLNHPAHLARRPSGGVAVFGQVPRAEGVFVVAHAVGKPHARMALVREEEIVVVNSTQVRSALFVEEHVVETNAVALGIDVELANSIRLVACVAEGLCHGWQLGHGGGRFEDPVAVGARRSARHQGATSGDADRAFAIGVGEASAAAG